MRNPEKLICIRTGNYDVIENHGVEEVGEVKRIKLDDVFLAVLTDDANTFLKEFSIEELQNEITKRSPLGKALE